MRWGQRRKSVTDRLITGVEKRIYIYIYTISYSIKGDRKLCSHCESAFALARRNPTDRQSILHSALLLARVMYDSDPERKSETPLLTKHPLHSPLPAVPLLRPILPVLPPRAPPREVRSPVNVASRRRGVHSLSPPFFPFPSPREACRS